MGFTPRLPSLFSLYDSFLLLALVGLAGAQTTLSPPGQPSHQGVIGGFELIGSSYVSAQQLFVGTPNKVYFVDKVENNPTKINGHPAWASEWTLGTNSQRAMDAITNSFCAGGNVLGNGTWLNVGGNQAVTFGGQPAASQNGGGPYDDPDGRNSIRLLTPCEDGTCDWSLSPTQSEQRWYPTLETLEDGSIIIIGGCRNGGYVNDASQDNPTYEFFPTKGASIISPILQRTLPANLFPLTWLLPSGKLLIQSNWATVLLDYHKNIETPLDNIPDAVRVYPASAGTIMLPLTPANNYTATVLFCGGSNVQPATWTSPNFIVPTYPASASCVTLTPDVNGSYVKDDALPDARTMANFIQLPDGKVLNLNGGKLGTAGYGNNSWAIGHSYGDSPVLTPAIYDPDAARGSRWSTAGLTASTVPRLYHSSATLLPDGSVLVSGSNPNPDYTVGPKVKYPTEYRTELFYPSYFNKRRPQPSGILASYTYGGPPFNISLDAQDLFGDVNNVKTAKVVIIRFGFSTHSMNMGQRYVQLESTYTGYQQNNTATLHVAQLPPNPAIIVPGPAFIFVVVNGIPSIGLPVMLGSGKIEKQPILSPASLPAASIVEAPTGSSSGSHSAARPVVQGSGTLRWIVALCSTLVVVLSFSLW
ncbi:copper radical oxidase [Hebeloma cylindrosporum]|uniref:Copper radical oxidase n=1 Tax=Hebeloma cylindrosporum TaxID=76867 RepID=A0A0C2YWN8_HEBCY|nr:copper radical oxidase [Hebeloma cylindrosporum h7]